MTFFLELSIRLTSNTLYFASQLTFWVDACRPVFANSIKPCRQIRPSEPSIDHCFALLVLGRFWQALADQNPTYYRRTPCNYGPLRRPDDATDGARLAGKRKHNGALRGHPRFGARPATPRGDRQHAHNKQRRRRYGDADHPWRGTRRRGVARIFRGVSTPTEQRRARSHVLPAQAPTRSCARSSRA